MSHAGHFAETKKGHTQSIGVVAPRGVQCVVRVQRGMQTDGGLIVTVRSEGLFPATFHGGPHFLALFFKVKSEAFKRFGVHQYRHIHSAMNNQRGLLGPHDGYRVHKWGAS